VNKVISFILLFFFISGLFVIVFNSVSASDLVQDSWNTKTPTSQPRFDLGVVAFDGKIYAIGGNPDAGGFVGTNERYDPKTDTWVTLTSMPTPRIGFAIAAYQGKIYCIGGLNKELLNVNEVYDIATDSWNTKTPLPVSEMFVQAHVVDEKIFVITERALYVYDPVEDSWTNKTSTPTQVAHMCSAIVDNKIIIIDQVAQRDYPDFGLTGKVITMKVMIYDPNADVWSEGQESSEYIDSMIRPRAAGATTGVYVPKKIYILFGFINHVYDPVEDAWSTIPGPQQEAFIGGGIAVVDDILYVIKGVHYPHNINIQYVPIGHKNAVPAPEPSNSTTQPPDTPEPSNPAALSATPEQSNPTTSEPTLTYIVIAALTLTTGTVLTSLFLYSKKRK